MIAAATGDFVESARESLLTGSVDKVDEGHLDRFFWRLHELTTGGE